MGKRKITTVLAVVLLAAACGGTTPDPAVASRVFVEANLLRNALDTSGHYGCRVAAEAVGDRPAGLWFTFGEVVPDAEQGWKALGASSRCGTGTFAAEARDYTATAGSPYLILDLSVAPARGPGEVVRLEAGLEIRKLSGFDDTGAPVYAPNIDRRTIDLQPAGELTLPLLLSDPTEKEAFGVHEVLARLVAQPLDAPSAAYGAVSITSDMPGAEIYLDGGLVGRTSERPVVVSNVLVGERKVRVRDLSGREVGAEVVVNEGETTERSFRLLPGSEPVDPRGLVSLGTNSQGFEELWRAEDGAIVVRVPAGEFLMGSPEGTGQPHERPQHRVHVSEFLIDKTEVTWRQFKTYADQTGAALPPIRSWGTPDDYPVSSVAWTAASAYCEWVGGRLPTEAEWEKAARGPESLVYPWGDDWQPGVCNSWVSGANSPREVGSHSECLSPYGLLDMAGNMWEWCSDYYAEDFYAESPSRDPRGPSSGRSRVIRGGGWVGQYPDLRTAHRFRRLSDSKYHSNGFRCVQARED